MEMLRTDESSVPNGGRRQLKSKLSQSIEAHRLRLQKAREAKYSKVAPLCECRKCDVTSMKPSMRCLHSSNKQTKVNEVIHSRVNESALLKQGIKNASVAGKSTFPGRPVNATPIPCQNRRNDAKDRPLLGASSVKPSPDSKTPQGALVKRISDNASLQQKNKLSDSALGLDIKENSIPSTQSISSRGNKSSSRGSHPAESANEASVASPDLTHTTMMNGHQSSRSSRLSGGCGTMSSSRSSKDKNEAHSEVNVIAKRLSSIHILDSHGDEHVLDTTQMDTKIQTMVTMLINDKFNRNETDRIEESKSVAHNTGRRNFCETFKCCESYPSVDSTDGLPDAVLESQRTTQQESLKASGSMSEASVDDAASVYKYKNVVDVLLDYISSGRSDKASNSADAVLQQLGNPEHTTVEPDVTLEPQVNKVTSHTAQPPTGNAICFWDIAKRPFLCCNNVDGNKAFLNRNQDQNVEHSPEEEVTSVLATEGAQTQISMPPSRMVSSTIGSREAMNFHMPGSQEMGYYIPYGPNVGQQYVPAYVTQPPYYTPVRYNYNPTVCPTMSCCTVNNASVSYPMGQLNPQMATQQMPMFSRTPTASYTKQHQVQAPTQTRMQKQTAPVPQRQLQGMYRLPTAAMPFVQNGTMKQVQPTGLQRAQSRRIPRMHTGVMPRIQTGGIPQDGNAQVDVGVNRMQMPARTAPRQVTGPLYRRNTGRAYLRHVQATMV